MAHFNDYILEHNVIMIIVKQACKFRSGRRAHYILEDVVKAVDDTVFLEAVDLQLTEINWKVTHI